MSDDRIAENVTWEQFREAIFAGWIDCMPEMHIDARAAWEHLLEGGTRFESKYDLNRQYFEEARQEWGRVSDDDEEDA